MCGVCGIVWTDPDRTTDPGLIERMTSRLVHRGPDGQGTYERPGVSLGHRRLRIIDLEGGNQPLANEDETVHVTFNGEIYNFAALRRDLERAGHRFRTRSDTEVLVHLYEEHGDDMLGHLRGMFAFGLWDGRRRRLLLARDRLGQKPLVYWQDEAGLRFASELKALLVENAMPRDVDPKALDDYLTYQYIPHPRTIFAGVSKLPPGHFAVYENGRLTVERYWRADFTVEEAISEEAAIERLRSEMAEATRLRMISDVPLGAFLSGGIDSTIVVGLMRQASNGPIRTFSIGFPVKQFDERVFARRAAEHLETEHEEFVVEPDALDVVGKLAWHYDEPFADSSAVPTYYVSQLTRQHVTVALTGDAGDELFAGYPRYRAVRIGEWFDRLPGIVRRALTCPCWQSLPASTRQKSRMRRLKKLLRYLGDPPRTRYRSWISIFDDRLRPTMYDRSFAERIGAHRSSEWIDSLYDELPDRDFVTRTTYVDLNSYLPGDLLTKVDIASMANGLECRSPFLDHRVVELAGRLPVGLKMRGMRQKELLKRAFPEFLPSELRDRPKMGFGVPIDQWLRRELAPMVRDLLLGSSFRQRGWFEHRAVERLVDEHLKNRWDHSYRLWALLMLELWARNFLDG